MPRIHPWVCGAVFLLALTLGSPSGWAQRERRPATAVPPPPEGMTFTTHLDHTAVWVGDQFHYTITVEYSPAYEFVLENLNKDTINMDPFLVFAVTWHTRALKDGNQRLTLDLTLASFATGQDSEQIPQLTLFYFRRDRPTASAQEAAAESLTVPAPEIGLRTTLPPDPEGLRDAITVTEWPGSRWLLGYAGWVCLAILVVGLGWESARFLQSRKTRQGPDRRQAMESVRLRWARGVPAEFSDPQVVREFYDNSYHSLKEYLGYLLETSAEALTAEELQEEMQRHGADADFTQKVVLVLATCERVRYGRDGTAPSSEAVHSTAQDIREILSFGSKK